MTYIDKIGLEIECVVYADDGERPDFEAFRTTTDGSLRINDSHDERVKATEYVSEPFPWPEKRDHAKERVEAVYEEIAEINRSMGLHIHVSFQKDFYYYAITSKKFHDYFIDRLRETDLYDDVERFRERVDGDVDGTNYAAHIPNHENIDDMLKSRSSNSGLKYRAINYQKRKYDTVEFRIFSAMDTAEQVMQAAEIVEEAINDYLDRKEYMESDEKRVGKEQEKKTVEIGEFDDPAADKKKKLRKNPVEDIREIMEQV